MQLHFYPLGGGWLVSQWYISRILRMRQGCDSDSLCERRPPRCGVGGRSAVRSPEPGRSGTGLRDARGNLCRILMEHQVEKRMWEAGAAPGALVWLGFCFLLCDACLLAPCHKNNWKLCLFFFFLNANYTPCTLPKATILAEDFASCTFWFRFTFYLWQIIKFREWITNHDSQRWKMLEVEKLALGWEQN